MKGLTNAYDVYKSYGIVFYIGQFVLFVIGVLLLGHFWEELKLRRSNVVIRVVTTILYSVLTLTVCLLAYLSFYWFCFRIIFENNASSNFYVILSAVIGVSAALICLGIILNTDFWTWIKNALCSGWKRLRYFTWSEFFKSMLHGAIKCLRRSFSYIKRHRLLCLLCVLIYVVPSIVFNLYQDGKERRQQYLRELSNLDIVKVPVVIDALEKQHGTILYPFFTDSLNNIKRRLNEKLKSSVISITPGSIEYIARSNGIDLLATYLQFKAISNNGYGLCINAQNQHNGTEQMVYFDFMSNRLDTISAENNNHIDYKSVFSPSGKTLICYADHDADHDSAQHGFIYNVGTRNLKKMPKAFPYNEDIIMTTDNDYYYLDDDKLYKGSLNSNNAPSIVRDFKSESLDFIHLIDSENIGAGDNDKHTFITYNLKHDSVTYRSNEHHRIIISDYDIRSINSEYVVSSWGVFDLKQDSLIVDSSDMLMWNNRPIEIKREDNKFVLLDLNGKVLKTIIKDDNNRYSSLFIRNNYLIAWDSPSIYIYNLGAKLTRTATIDAHDKKVFDLK